MNCAAGPAPSANPALPDPARTSMLPGRGSMAPRLTLYVRLCLRKNEITFFFSPSNCHGIAAKATLRHRDHHHICTWTRRLIESSRCSVWLAFCLRMHAAPRSRFGVVILFFHVSGAQGHLRVHEERQGIRSRRHSLCGTSLKDSCVLSCVYCMLCMLCAG